MGKPLDFFLFYFWGGALISSRSTVLFGLNPEEEEEDSNTEEAIRGRRIGKLLDFFFYCFFICICNRSSFLFLLAFFLVLMIGMKNCRKQGNVYLDHDFGGEGGYERRLSMN